MSSKGGKVLLIAAALIVAGGLYGRNMLELPTPTSPAVPSVTASPTPITTPTPRPAKVLPSAVVRLVQAHDEHISIADDTGPRRCDYILDNTQHATVVWTDGIQAYSISGNPNDMGLLYMDMLPLDTWESCRYSIKDHPRIGYGDGAKVSDLYGTVQDYSMAFHKASGAAPTPAPTPEKYEYVLNKESKIFHWSGCYQVERIKKKNRQVVTTTREKLIKKGYDPCGICEP